MATKKELITAAKELNKVLGLDPAIDTSSRVKLADLEEAIKQAIELIEPEDEFTEATQAIIDAFSPEDLDDEEDDEDLDDEDLDDEDLDEDEDEDDDEDDEEDDEDEDDDEDDDEDEDDEEDDEDDNDDGNEPEAKDSKDEEKPVVKEKEKTENKLTKKAIVERCIEKGATIEQIAQEIVKAGIDDDFEKNCRVVKAWLGKMGFDTKKAAVEANPIFKLKK